jgi:hypothetical protein
MNVQAGRVESDSSLSDDIGNSVVRRNLGGSRVAALGESIISAVPITSFVAPSIYGGIPNQAVLMVNSILGSENMSCFSSLIQGSQSRNFHFPLINGPMSRVSRSGSNN